MEEATYNYWLQILEKAKDNFENAFVGLEMARAQLAVAEAYVTKLEEEVGDEVEHDE